MESGTPLVELDKLVGLFFGQINDLGEFSVIPPVQLPEPQRSLLHHEHHMTVTVEKFHSSAVDVQVLRELNDSSSYSREICLHRKSDQKVVQYGIVRLNFDHLGNAARQEILLRQKPLGRILIEHDILRKVRLLGLYEIRPTENLAKKLDCDSQQSVFGRTAIIYCNEEPAIELLEIVTV